MFRHEGPARDPRLNALLAAYLASIAGFVNTGGLILLGMFTSHVTGSIGRLGADVARGDFAAALFALLLVLAFFFGAFGASLLIEGSTERMPAAYALALALQGVMLASFVFAAQVVSSDPRVLDAQAALLCGAMGMQNSLVTRLSGAVVRTTHLTGIVTDLGIELARWYRWHRSRLRVPVLFPGRIAPTKPEKHEALLLVTITLAFCLGALLGGILTLRANRWAMALPAIAIFVASAYAYSQRDRRSE